MERNNNINLTKNQKFWRSLFGKVLREIVDFFDDIIDRIRYPKPSSPSRGAMFDSSALSRYGQAIEEYAKEERDRKNKRRRDWQKRMGYVDPNVNCNGAREI